MPTEEEKQAEKGSANGSLEFIGRATGLMDGKQRSGGATPVTQIIINLAPGVEMPSPIIEGESREIPEGDES